jgi:hypothetical protein
MVLHSTALAVYLVVVFGVAALASMAALGTATAVVVRSRRARLAEHVSVCAYYRPRLALHH